MRGCWGQCFGCPQASTSQCTNLTLLLIGINNAGKTTVLNSLKGDLHSQTVPTYGFSSADILAANCNLKVYDLGGGRNIRRIWTIYTSEVHGIIYVIDAADPGSFEEARTALHQLLEAPQLAGKPVLVLANKQDLPDVQPLDTVEEALGLRQLQIDRKAHHILSCTARAAGQQQPDPALRQGLQWLIDTINPVYAYLQAKIAKESAEAKAAEELRRKEREERAKQSRLNRQEREKQQEQQAQQGRAEQQQQPEQLQASEQPDRLGKASLNEDHCEPAITSSSTSSTVQDSCSSASRPQITCGTRCGGPASAQPPVALEASGSGAFSRADAQLLGSTANECCVTCSAMPSAALAASSTLPAGGAPCDAATPAVSSLVKQDSVVSSPDTEAVSITNNNINNKQAGSASPSMPHGSGAVQAPGPGCQLLGLLMQALPGSVPAGTPTAFSNLKQAAYDECCPTPRSFSISSDASSLFLSEPPRQHKPSAPPVHSHHNRHATAAETSAGYGATVGAERQTEAGAHDAPAGSTGLLVQSAADVAVTGSHFAIASRSVPKGKPGQTNRVQPE